jgi:hypothetical protein
MAKTVLKVALSMKIRDAPQPPPTHPTPYPKHSFFQSASSSAFETGVLNMFGFRTWDDVFAEMCDPPPSTPTGHFQKSALFSKPSQDICKFSKPRHMSSFKTKTSVFFQSQDICHSSKPRHLSFFKTKTSVLFQNQDICPFSKPRHLPFFKIKTSALFQNQDICPFSKSRHLFFFKTKTSVLFQNQDVCPFPKSRHLSFFKTKTSVLFQNQDICRVQNQDICPFSKPRYLSPFYEPGATPIIYFFFLSETL